jgi:hypothetical protein
MVWEIPRLQFASRVSVFSHSRKIVRTPIHALVKREGITVMAQYVITYLGGNPPSSPEEGKKNFANYQQWLSALGDAAVSPANPLKDTHTIHPDGAVSAGSKTGMSGFTVVEAESLDAALAIARACPFLEVGGTLEVSELMQMKP